MKGQLINKETALSVTAVALAMISLTAGAALAKSMFSYIDPASVTAIRFIMSAVFLTCVLRAWEVQLTRDNIGSVVVYGGMIAGMNLFFYLAIETIPIGMALAIELLGPLSVSIVYSRKRSDVIWVALVVVGITLLLPTPASVTNLDTRGVLYALVAGAFWGAYVIAGKKAGRRHGSKAPALGLIVASILVFPVGFEALSFSIIDWNVLMLIAAVALLSSVIPLILEMKALRHLPTKTYGVLTSGEPVVGAAVGFFVLGEQLTTLQLLGLATIVTASIGAVMSPIPSIKRLKNIKGYG
ncbi:putative permease, DMT superfamily [Shewanella psychrophila]|uniref:Putative permease, DMT superfamily n=1 Tax=Shewanella psychrophila TaxID=225848 RepID=A0A1S6HT05_9GAMM|nr:EamA family transporter [Shewanella psychrophila]AQS38655.1 putative permease, DMT superfamily [Shewanella psychrophila]